MADELMAARASQAEWSGLASAAGEGRLRMEPGTAEACAAACDEARLSLVDHAMTLNQAQRLDGLGVWGSGQQLATKFREKVTGGDASANEVLRAHQEVLETMAQTFRSAGAAYSATEEQNAGALQGNG